MLYDSENLILDGKSMSVEKKAYSIEQASASTSLSKPYLRNKIREGSLKATKFGRRVLILKDDLDSFLKAGCN